MAQWITNDILQISDEIGALAETIKGDLHGARSQVQDREPVMNIIVNAELQLMSLKMELKKLRGYVVAAQNTGGLPKPGPAYPDRRSAAAHDDTLFDTMDAAQGVLTTNLSNE